MSISVETIKEVLISKTSMKSKTVEKKQLERVTGIVSLHEETAKRVKAYKGVTFMTKVQNDVINFSLSINGFHFTTPDISIDLKFHFFQYHK